VGGFAECVRRARGGGGGKGAPPSAHAAPSSRAPHKDIGEPHVAPFTACVNSRVGAAATFASLLALSLLLPGTLIFAAVQLRCAPPAEGGYQLEDPALSCRDPRYAAYAGALQAAWVYLLVPLGVLFAACGARPGPPSPALRAFAAGYAPTHLGKAWEALCLLRKAAMAATAAGLLGVTHPPSALLGVVAWLFGALFLQLAARPFERPVLNLLEGLGLLAGAAASLALLPRLQPAAAAPLAGLDAAAIGLLLLFSAAWAVVAGDALLAGSAGLARATACVKRWRGGGAKPTLPGSSGDGGGAAAAGGMVLRGLDGAPALQTRDNPLRSGADGGEGGTSARKLPPPASTGGWHAGFEEWRPVLGLPPLGAAAAAAAAITGRTPAASRIVRSTRTVELPAGQPITTTTVSPIAAAARGALLQGGGAAPVSPPELRATPPEAAADAAARATQAPPNKEAGADDPWSHD
jgi:hypothetical protein